MGKFKDTEQTRKELSTKFKNERGATVAFCRQQGITTEWFRLVLAGEHEDLQLLINAADFLVEFKRDKESERAEKKALLEQKVALVP